MSDYFYSLSYLVASTAFEKYEAFDNTADWYGALLNVIRIENEENQ